MPIWQKCCPIFAKKADDPVKLKDLAPVEDDLNVTGFAIDHRKVVKGNVFGAFRGAAFNGEDFIDGAVAHGAVAVVALPDAKVSGAAHIADPQPRRKFAEMAATFYGPYPEVIVAVTGTNGKTSTVEMTRQLWRMAGHRSASIGTLGVTTADDQTKTGLTTPDIVTFLNNVAGLKRMGVSHVAYEASSHGLDQHRAEGVPLKAVAFTNFSRDHLDYHPTMDEYFAAKMRLFDDVAGADAVAVVWADDAKSAEVMAHVRQRGLNLMTVGEAGDTITLVSRQPTSLGQQLGLRYEGKDYQLNLPLIGAYQVNNVLTAAALVLATGGDWPATLSGMARVAPVRGRLERAVISRAGAPVYVDYAHTPDALEAACAALRPHVEHRLITVFGAGGDRDTGKRAPMGEVAARMSDVVIVTDDNPRSEDPAAIRKAILDGAPGAIEIGGRREAIAEAVRMAGAGDIILLAGKGHETGQIVGNQVLPFDDSQVARECAS
jgi:UDP-N-acetylmuramoyl-L-alanyl-D-glutamate--2,6-diaminopimelate ligase